MGLDQQGLMEKLHAKRLTQAEIDRIARILDVQDDTHDAVIETVEADPYLARYAAQYQRMSEEDKGRMTWQEIKERLEANESRYLNLAKAMEQGGVLFGVDRAGNPLIADAGDEPIMKGMNYWNTREAVYGKAGEETGYEMFKVTIGDYEKTEEICAYEKATGKPFVFCPETDKEGKKIPEKKRWKSSWLDNRPNVDKTLSKTLTLCFNPHSGKTCMFNDDSSMEDVNRRGVRRLLRVGA